MKINYSRQGNQALTLTEVMVVIAVLIFFAWMLLPKLAGNKKSPQKISCVNNLKQLGLATKIWAGDNHDQYPTAVSVTNGGAMELMNTSEAWKVFQVISNELGTPKVLFCPEDSLRESATNFGNDLKNKISYFINPGATDEVPQSLISGDDNFEINGTPLPAGWRELSTNAAVSWTTARHNQTGNILMSDGSVQSTTISGLRACLQNTRLATNRLFIP